MMSLNFYVTKSDYLQSVIYNSHTAMRYQQVSCILVYEREFY